jgi:hypothetical protein
MSYVIRTYEGQDEWGSKKFLAHMNLGNDIYMSFFGSSASEAEGKARSWYDRERARWGKLDTSEEPAKPAASGWGKGAGWNSPGPIDKRGAGFAGKVWMFNRENHRVRVTASEQALWEVKGYRKGGPRSVWKD